MKRNIDLCSCHFENNSQLLFTQKIRKQVKNLFPVPITSNVIVRLKELRTGTAGGWESQKATEMVLRKEDNIHYLQMLSALSVFERSSQNVFVPLLLSVISGHIEDSYDVFLDKELFHIALVRQVALAVSMKTAVAHDHSKDALYLFVTCGKYGGIDATDTPGFQSVFTEEVNRHFSLEPHHPQFEHLRKTECRDCDIEEMAIDRLSRNVVANGGHIDHEQMTFFLPHFELGDPEKKLLMYKKSVSKLESTVVGEYHKLLIGRSPSQSQLQAEARQSEGAACNGKCFRAIIEYIEPNIFTIELRVPL